MNHRHHKRTMEDSVQELSGLIEERLIKAPLAYTGYSLDEAHYRDFPDYHTNDEYKHIKSMKLPNGLEYRQFKHKHSLPHQGRLVHALYNPHNPSEALAYMETSHEEDDSVPEGYHPHTVNISEVNPEYRGKGLGRQLYMATLLHGTGRLTSDDKISPEAHSMWKAFKTYPGLGGKISSYSNDPSNKKAYDRHQVFIRDKRKLNPAQMFPAVDFTSKLAASESEDSWLSKAVDDKSWNRIVKAHNKAVREDVVDSAAHIDYFNKQNQHYNAHVLDHPKKAKAMSTRDSGASPKMIHQVDHPSESMSFMAKPYHAPIERWAKDWTKHPIKGWASLTTKKLFDQADMSDMSEDISAHVHKGVPIVVSRFHPEAQEIYGDDEPFAPTDTAKLLVMDFLTHNQDRHAGNIMKVNEATPFAIDHERNFQFFKPKPGFDPMNSLHSALKNSAFAYKNRHLPSQIDMIGEQLVDWWKKSGDNVKKELHRNLKFIKDPAIKRHIADNFNARWDHINDYMHHGDPSSLFDKSTFGVPPLPFAKERKKV